MTIDWSHLDTVIEAEGAPWRSAVVRAVAIRQAILSALTPADLARLIAEKCPGWVAVPREPTEDMDDAATDAVGEAVKECLRLTDKHNERTGDNCRFIWGGDPFIRRMYPAMLAAAPKLGE